MYSLPFYKLLPSGNATIILTSEECMPSLANYSAKLMHPMHVQAEQVGLLLWQNNTLPHLQMMGGEFCINATRAATLVLARNNQLAQAESGCWQGFISVSGATAPLHILASPCQDTLKKQILHFLTNPSLLEQSMARLSTANTLAAKPTVTHLPVEPITTEQGATTHHTAESATIKPAVAEHSTEKRTAAGQATSEEHQPVYSTPPARLFCAARLSALRSQVLCTNLEQGVDLVHMPGISHLLLDQNLHEKPENWQGAAKNWRIKAKLEELEASGVIWYTKDTAGGYTICPAVYVKNTNSEHMETACGSGSFALAYLHTQKHHSTQEQSSLAITQPSQESIEVVLTQTKASVDAYIFGQVRLVADGHVYIAKEA